MENDNEHPTPLTWLALSQDSNTTLDKVKSPDPETHHLLTIKLISFMPFKELGQPYPQPEEQPTPDHLDWTHSIMETYDHWALKNVGKDALFADFFNRRLGMDFLYPGIESRLKQIRDLAKERQYARISNFSLTDDEYLQLLPYFLGIVKDEAKQQFLPLNQTSIFDQTAITSKMLLGHMVYSHPTTLNILKLHTHLTEAAQNEYSRRDLARINSNQHHKQRLTHTALMQSFTRRLVSSLVDENPTIRSQAWEMFSFVQLASAQGAQMIVNNSELIAPTIASSLLVGDFDLSWFGWMKAIGEEELRNPSSRSQLQSKSSSYLHIPGQVLTKLNDISKITIDGRVLEHSMSQYHSWYPEAEIALIEGLNQLRPLLQSRNQFDHETEAREDLDPEFAKKVSGVVNFKEDGSTHVQMSLGFLTEKGQYRIVDYTVVVQEAQVWIMVHALYDDTLSQSTIQSLVQAAAHLVQAETARLSKTGIQFAPARETSHHKARPTSRWRKLHDTTEIPTRTSPEPNSEASFRNRIVLGKEIETLLSGFDRSVSTTLKEKLNELHANNFQLAKIKTPERGTTGPNGGKIYSIRLSKRHRALAEEYPDGSVVIYEVYDHDEYEHRLDGKK